jgi:hypothetical protein
LERKYYEHSLRVLRNKVLSKIVGSEMKEVTGDWRRQHKQELLNLYTSQNIMRVIRSRKMTWRSIQYKWENLKG